MAVIQADVFWELHLENSVLKPLRDILDQIDLTDAGRTGSDSCATAAGVRTGRSKRCCERCLQ